MIRRKNIKKIIFQNNFYNFLSKKKKQNWKLLHKKGGERRKSFLKLDLGIEPINWNNVQAPKIGNKNEAITNGAKPH